MPSFNKPIPGDRLKSDKPITPERAKQLIRENREAGEKLPGGPTDLGKAIVDALNSHLADEES